MNVNNTIRGFIPELYDASVLRTLEDNLVMKQICKATIKAPIKEYGDTVYFTDLADPTITDYTGTITHEDLSDSQIAMLIDKTKTFAFKVKDVDALMANLDVKGSQTERAGYMLKDKIERDLFQNVGADANAGTAITATVTSANVISTLALYAQRLADNNVMESNLFMVIPPWLQLKLKMAGISFQINNGLNGKGGMQWSKELGFDIYVTNTVYNAGTADTPVSTVLAGSYQAIGYADHMLKTRMLELESTRANGVDGGIIYGYKVKKPRELQKGTLTFGAESSTL
jgi:hypothetical protein